MRRRLKTSSLVGSRILSILGVFILFWKSLSLGCWKGWSARSYNLSRSKRYMSRSKRYTSRFWMSHTQPPGYCMEASSRFVWGLWKCHEVWTWTPPSPRSFQSCHCRDSWPKPASREFQPLGHLNSFRLVPNLRVFWALSVYFIRHKIDDKDPCRSEQVPLYVQNITNLS